MRTTIVMVCVLLTTSVARAQSAKAEAEVLFRQGREAMTKGKIAEACDLFQESQKLDPTISTLVNEANCREKNRQLATSWGLFLEAERLTRNLTRDPEKLHDLAVERSRKLEARVSKLTIRVPAAHRIAGLEILRGTYPLAAALWDRALPVDGGTYAIVARAGEKTWTTTVTIAAEGQALMVDIPKLDEVTAAPPPPSTNTPPPAETGTTTVTTMPAEPTRTTRRSNTIPLVLGVGGAILVTMAIGFEVSARSTYDSALDSTDNDTRESRWQSANTKRYTAEVLAVGGLGCVGIAIWLYMDNRKAASSTTTSGLLIEPYLTNEAAGIGVVGRY